uniref:Uncharacterized protein n=1 Tax=Arundo donax TaxID=35708 RepID=A0A0A8XY73_ARUDO
MTTLFFFSKGNWWFPDFSHNNAGGMKTKRETCNINKPNFS